MDGKTDKTRNGWRDIPGTKLRINRRGELQSIRNGKTMSPRRTIRTDSGGIATAKIVLWLFAGITPRPGQVVFRDGNRKNFGVENVRYRAIDPAEFETGGYASRAEMVKCLKIRFRALEDARGGFDIQDRIIIHTIAKSAGFRLKNTKKPHWDIFMLWLGEKNCFDGLNEGEIARRKNMAIRDVKKVVDYFLGRAVEYVAPARRKTDQKPTAAHDAGKPDKKPRKNAKNRRCSTISTRIDT